MNKLMTKIVGAALGLTMAIGVGVAAGNGNSAVAPVEAATVGTSYTISTSAAESITAGKTYVIASAVGNDSTFLAAKSSSTWGTAVAKANAYIFSAESTTNGFALKCDDGYLNPRTSSSNTFLAYSNSKPSTAIILLSGNIVGTYSTEYPLRQNGSSGFRWYGKNGTTGTAAYLYEATASSTDPSIDSIEISGSPAASSNVVGGSSWTMSATVVTSNDDGKLDTTVDWTVLPSGAVTFSKTNSDSEEEITVTATNNAYNNVVITATSHDSNYSSVDADSNSFNITKSYTVNTNTLVTKDGESSYDASGASSKVVTLTAALTYSGDEGAHKVDLTVSPSSGVSLSSTTNFTAASAGSDFTATFTKDGTYTITSTPQEATGKAASVTITVSGIVVPGYDLVTSTGSLRNGATIVIYSYAKQKIMGNSAASSLRTGLSLTVAEGDVDFIPSANIPENTEILTLVQSGSHWELKTSGNKYLSLTSDANAQNISDNPDTTNNTTEWDISFSGNNVLIQSVAYSARYLESNSSSGNFGCYKGTQSKVQLYLLRNTDPFFSINMTSMYLGPLGTQTLSLTAHNNASDTVTWSTSDASVASIPDNSTGMSVVVTGVAVGTTTITATFGHPATYEALVCSVEVLDLEPYVNVGVTTFTKTTTKPTGGWAGTYLIGDSTGKTILDGSLSPLPGGGTNYATLASLPDSVSATSEIISKSFTIKATATEGEYTIRSNSYYFIGNSTTNNGMDTSIGESYNVSISDTGVMTMNGTTLAYNTGTTYRFFKNLSDNIRAATLWRADGEMREITNTLSAWYSTVKSEEYLVCNASGSGSKINWSKLEETAAELSSSDLDTLENMTAKPSEDGGNYLEDLISDYDYLVAVKNYDDFLGREAAGTLSVAKANKVSLFRNDNTSSVIIITLVSLISISAFSAYLFLRKRKEQ